MLVQFANEFKMDRSKNLSICLLTWNTGGLTNTDSELTTKSFGEDPIHDCYLLTLQELDYLNISNPWHKMVLKPYFEKNYVLLGSYQSNCVRIWAYVKRKDMKFYSDVKVSYVNFMFNEALKIKFKAAAAIRFKYNGVRIAAAGCHFTAHEFQLHARVYDYFQLEKLCFSHAKDLFQYQDYCIIFGDLNFRLMPMNVTDNIDEFEKITKYIYENKCNSDPDRWEFLLNYDEIRFVQSTGRAFISFEEPKITFPPTFKFIVKSVSYDRKRRPAWTDRILSRNRWLNVLREKNRPNYLKPFQPEQVQEQKILYNSIDFRLSDHRPVIQIIKLPVGGLRQVIEKIPMNMYENNLFPTEIPIESISESSGTGSINQAGNILQSGNQNVSYKVQFNCSGIILLTSDFSNDFEVKFEIRDEFGEDRVYKDHWQTYLSVWDWVGLFPDGFFTINDFLVYAYPEFPIDNHDESSLSTASMSCQDESGENSSIFKIEEFFTVRWAESILAPIIQTEQNYLLLYIRANGDVIGMSEPIKFEFDPDSSNDDDDDME